MGVFEKTVVMGGINQYQPGASLMVKPQWALTFGAPCIRAARDDVKGVVNRWVARGETHLQRPAQQEEDTGASTARRKYVVLPGRGAGDMDRQGPMRRGRAQATLFLMLGPALGTAG